MVFWGSTISELRVWIGAPKWADQRPNAPTLQYVLALAVLRDSFPALCWLLSHTVTGLAVDTNAFGRSLKLPLYF